MTIKTSDVYNWNVLDSGRPFAKGNPSIYDSSPLLKLITKNINYQEIVSNKADFYITATDYSAQEQVVLECKSLSEPDLVKFAYGSASPPILFPPVQFGDKLLVDGGITGNFNIENALAIDGVDTIVLMYPTPKQKSQIANNIVDMINGTITIATYNQLNEELMSIQKLDSVINDIDAETKKQYKDVKLIIITPDKPVNIDLIDFDYKYVDRKEMYNYGYTLAKEILTKCLLI